MGLKNSMVAGAALALVLGGMAPLHAQAERQAPALAVPPQ